MAPEWCSHICTDGRAQGNGTAAAHEPTSTRRSTASLDTTSRTAPLKMVELQTVTRKQSQGFPGPRAEPTSYSTEFITTLHCSARRCPASMMDWHSRACSPSPARATHRRPLKGHRQIIEDCCNLRWVSRRRGCRARRRSHGVRVCRSAGCRPAGTCVRARRGRACRWHSSCGTLHEGLPCDRAQRDIPACVELGLADHEHRLQRERMAQHLQLLLAAVLLPPAEAEARCVHACRVSRFSSGRTRCGGLSSCCSSACSQIRGDYRSLRTVCR